MLKNRSKNNRLIKRSGYKKRSYKKCGSKKRSYKKRGSNKRGFKKRSYKKRSSNKRGSKKRSYKKRSSKKRSVTRKGQFGGINPHTDKKQSSYSCKKGERGIDGEIITIKNCNNQGNPSRCKIAEYKDGKQKYCRKTQSASRKRGQTNWDKVKKNLKGIDWDIDWVVKSEEEYKKEGISHDKYYNIIRPFEKSRRFSPKS